MVANDNKEGIHLWWPVIVVLTSMAIAWGSMQSQVQVLADEVKELSEEEKKHDAKEAADSTKVEVLTTKQEAILEDVGEIKETQKGIKAEQEKQGRQLDRIESLIRNETES
jgi:hypothetical protein